MTAPPIRFTDGAGYERMMGVWSRLAGAAFLDWLNPAPNLAWIDIGCGNGAFTELLAQRGAPASIHGIDPAEGQLAFARARAIPGQVRFTQGDALALPADAGSADAAIMALVIFFVPDPARALAEMRRVVRPGGLVAAYAWDMMEPGGFPLRHMQDQLRAMGRTVILPPKAEASRTSALHGLWAGAGLTGIAQTPITVARTYAGFDEYWETVQTATSLTQASGSFSDADRIALRTGLQARLPASDASGRLTFTARANAISGRVPA